MRAPLLALVASLLLATTSATPSFSRPESHPKVIIFGGGWGPEGTQASIELHTAALARALQSVAPVVLFAGPRPNTRSVQIKAEGADPVSEILGLVLNHSEGLGVAYRLSPVARKGPATESRLRKAIAKTRKNPRGTIVFGVGHGRRTSDDEGAESVLSLWGSENELGLSELAGDLSKPRRGPIAFVLGQCHSGGFADIVYSNGDPKQPLAGKRHRRCALAAVPRDRAASGCTSDLHSIEAKAFMAVVAKAFEKDVRETADLDRDGSVSIEEAFTYARILDRTVNVPVRSSELFMRDTLGPKAPSIEDWSVEKLIRNARATERAVLRSQTPSPKKAHDVVEAIAELDRVLDAAETQIEPKLEHLDETRRKLQDALFDQWPELTNLLHPVSRQLLSGSADRVVEFLMKHPALPELKKAARAVAKADALIEQTTRKRARLERWLRAAQNVVYERQIRKDPKLAAALDSIYACESLAPL